MHVGLWSEFLKGKDFSEDVDVVRRIILNLILNKYHRSIRAGFFNLRLGTIGAVSSINLINLWFHSRPRISWVIEPLLDSHVLYFMGLFT
jgi:hypothetical protein